MKSKLHATLVGLAAATLAAALVAGCATGMSAKAQAEKGGAQLWGETCGRCHNVPSPSTFSASEWEVIMQHMRLRANLTAEQHKKILAFMKSSTK